MNTAQPQPNDILHRDSEPENALTKSNDPQSTRPESAQADSAMQALPTKRRLSFWEAAYYWIMARH